MLTNSTDVHRDTLSKRPFTTTRGSLNLTWPRYGINNGTYA
ncbi:unnamed protein product, partial [Rotaria sp. Silwood2]